MVPALLTQVARLPFPMLCVAGSSGRCRMLDQPHPILVKRYAETRLFDTTRAQYVTRSPELASARRFLHGCRRQDWRRRYTNYSP